ncbi:hypothetical protein Tco_1281472, partial [Tanacetum coccineum]
YDDGVITNFNNLPDEVDVITNPTLRIHNAHPQSQILRDPNTHVQTRSSLKKITEAHALVSYIQAHQRSNHKDQQYFLFACFLSQFEPRKVSKALEDGSWVLKGSYREQKDVRGVARIEALRSYCLTSSGFVDPDHPTKVYKVVKALYGLHQASRAWYATLEEQASLAEIARIQAEDEAKNARREELKRQDELTAKRLQEELEWSEAQKKRMAQVQEAARFYTEEDWETIRAKLEANADLVKEIVGEDVSEANYAQRMVGLISQRRKHIAKQKAKSQRDKPMTQAQQRQYMATYLKNQGRWKLAQIKKLIDEELKEKFEYLIRSMERFVPMDTEKEHRKRTGVELQTESSKKLKSDTREDVSVPKEKDKEPVKKEEEFEIKKPVLRYTKRKSLARKGLQKKPESVKSGAEEDVEAYMKERVDEPSSEEFPIGSIPQGPAPAKIVKWQIIKTGKRGAYQIIREDNTDVVYVNFQGLLNDLTRDDLKELYRLMMLKYGDNRPEEEFERLLNWRYFHSCSVHCLTMEAAHIYMLTEVKYPLPPRVCKAMLEKKLLGDRKDESTMSNRHKDWLVQEQTALGKDFSNPFMADNLPKIVWLSTHHIYACKELASPQGYGLW